MDTYPDLCDTLAARQQRQYIEVREFFLSRAAKKEEKKDEEKALLVSRRDNKKEYRWCKKRGMKWDNHITSKCFRLNKEKRKGKQPSHTASATTMNDTMFTVLATTNQSKDETTATWLCDSGASNHLSPFVGDFINLSPTNVWIIRADGRTHNAHACGDAWLEVRLLNGSKHTIVLTRTLYVSTF